ncbi:MAG: VWA domain-containing protein [Bacteroidales bacterium]|nr:VWA domain-containing protein [Bacteroidales bacterium]
MNFEHTTLLWLLSVIPLMVIAFIIQERLKRRRLNTFADSAILHRLQPDVSSRRPIIKLILLCLGVGMLIIAWANPRIGSKIAEGEQKGIDMAVCIDVSNSMLAQDMKPNRMARTKQVVQNLISQLGGDRVSLVVFAGSAYIEMPLTNDYGATKMFLDQIGTDLISEQGTAIGDAIEKGMATLGYGIEGNDDEPQWEPNKSRAIVIISDGENHEDDAKEAAEKAAKQGIMVCTIGIGTATGGQIPITDGRGQVKDWLKDSEGNVVTTHLNEEMLHDIAKAGNGIYVHAGNGNAAVEEIVKQLHTLDSQKFGAAQFVSFKSQYQYPLAAGLLFLFVEFFILERRNPRFSLNRIIKRKKI